MSSDGAPAEVNRTSTLFLDIRDSTLFIDNYDERVVSDLLDALFSKARETIQEQEGEVDKIIGDGLMAVFQGDEPGRRAVEAALSIYEDDVRATEQEQKFSTIEVGIGIATGPVHETTLAGVDSTVVGRAVNIAARLQGLCKDYDLSILIDTNTWEDIHPGDIPDTFATREIPDRNLRGIQQSVDTINICDTGRLNTTYIKTFGQGIDHYLNHNYDAALSEFTKAYTRYERYADQALLNHFTNECLDRIHGSRDLFSNPDRYEQHSTTQQTQGMRLESYIRQELMMRDAEPELVLDIGCGTGKMTTQIQREMFPDAKVVAIDTSSRAIAKARADHNPDDLNIEYREGRIERYCPEEEHNQYDLILSNSALHWVDEQDQAYENIHTLLSEDGILAVHQGGKGSYRELHYVAVDLIDQFDYRGYFENLNPPLDLNYYDEEEMKALLRRHDFDIQQFNVSGGDPPDTIIEDFAEASLNAYSERLDSESQREVFREQFKQEAHKEYNPEDITVRRLYFTAVPQKS